jgi:hypothetical protein
VTGLPVPVNFHAGSSDKFRTRFPERALPCARFHTRKERPIPPSTKIVTPWRAAVALIGKMRGSDADAGEVNTIRPKLAQQSGDQIKSLPSAG